MRVTYDGADRGRRALAPRVEPWAGAPRAEAHGDGLSALPAAARVAGGEEGVDVDCGAGRVRRSEGRESGESGAHLLHSMKGVRKISLSGMAAYCGGGGQREPAGRTAATYENEDEEGDDAGTS